MKIATLAQSPVFGGRVKSVDDSAAKAVKGVRQIVRLDDAIWHNVSLPLTNCREPSFFGWMSRR
ncbi:MAG: hypothetical protein CR217_05215 [Beijerinckiaceae bacterium]|nr:MAG: hypothetical protein CR217_05215 [Beijerinckiaceae bacterium]